MPLQTPWLSLEKWTDAPNAPAVYEIGLSLKKVRIVFMVAIIVIFKI